MLRPTLLRSAVPRLLPRLTTFLVPRFATTHAPTTSSGPVSGEISTPLAPGEEVDPQLNGYPQLPYVSIQRRSPLGWWNVQDRKNFGEVMHEEADALGMWGPDDYKLSPWNALGQLSLVLGVMGGFAYFIYLFAPENPATSRSYPFNGLEAEMGGRNVAKPEEENVGDE